MPCCSHTYEKYLSAPGQVDLQALAHILKELKDPRPVEEVAKTICKCMCHVIGLSVRH
jgi:hypothetical protein